MNLYGYEGCVGQLTQYRQTRTPGGRLTDRQYRLTTMLTERGDIYALGEADVIDPNSGIRFRREAQVVIPRAAVDDEESVWKVLDPYFDHLDKAVECAVPHVIEDGDQALG